MGNRKQLIPNNLHFIFGLAPDFGGKPFSFCHWAAIRSAQVANPEWKANFWFIHKPSGRYFDAIRPHVELHELESFDAVFERAIPHPAHKCDWLRLQVLQSHGGVYLDLDTITVKPFAPLLTPPATMVVESVGHETIGLCNAFIAAEKESQFIAEWSAKFRDFRSTGHDRHWNESAVKWPHELWRSGSDVTAQLPSYFMKPDWTQIGQLFEEAHEFPMAIGHHLWESFSWPYLERYTPETYRESDCTYSRLLEKHLGQEIRDTFLT